MTLALRYLHKEKRIVHRDLTPNNIMLGENDKVTISKCCFYCFANVEQFGYLVFSIVGDLL
jgi:NIMA (never in mitosis gene a)-related kinase